MGYFIQGLTLGLAYVAPIGLQNLFVINTALTQKKSRVYATALIVIFFDVTLALACFFGIGAIMQTSRWLQMAVLLIGSLIVKNQCEVTVTIAVVVTLATREVLEGDVVVAKRDAIRNVVLSHDKISFLKV